MHGNVNIFHYKHLNNTLLLDDSYILKIPGKLLLKILHFFLFQSFPPSLPPSLSKSFYFFIFWLVRKEYLQIEGISKGLLYY